MIISYAFLKDILKSQCPKESNLASKLIQIGFEVEEVIPAINKDVQTVQVTKVEKIGDEESLFKVTVTDKKDFFTVVTSWDKVNIGEIYVHAKPGVEILGSLLTEKSFGSLKSFGMLLSYTELELEADILTASEKEGLLKLPDDTPVGKNFYDLFWLSDSFFHLKIPFNRPDCYSFLGLLREITCAYEISLPSTIRRDIHWLYPAFSERSLKRSVARSDFKHIEISNKESCPYYTGIILEKVTVTNSTFEIRKRLFAFHAKPINNVVDIVNLLMLYFGQPLHTFDLDKIIGKHILVRHAKLGETIEAIDGKSYSLTEDDLIIADEIHPIGLAGIIGGKDTEIRNQTVNVFIESAYFSPITISRTSNRLNLVTDASSRFGKGVEQNQVREILMDASYLISSLCGASVAGETVQEGSLSYKPREILITPKDFVEVTGLEVSKYSFTHILNNLEIPFDIRGLDNISIKVPSFRETDLKEKVDIIEEVLRFVGYDKIIPKTPVYKIKFAPANEKIKHNSNIGNYLVGMGFHEIITDSIVPDEEVNLFFTSDNEGLIRIANPMKAGLSYLSPHKIIQFLSVIKRNMVRKQNEIRMFEFGKHYFIQEEEYLNIALSGQTDPETWYEKPRKVDFYFAKGVLESLLKKYNVPFTENKTTQFNLFDCNESVDFYIGNHPIGSLGIVLPKILAYYEIDCPVYFGFIQVSKIAKYIDKNIKFESISPIQDITRDIAFTVLKSVRLGDILEKIKDTASKSLKETVVFDVYSGPNIGEDLKSIAIRLIFNFGQNVYKEKIQEDIDSIVLELEKSFQISIRK